MPFCPSCRSEYILEIAKCPDCDITLVEHLPEAPTSAPMFSEVDLDEVELCVILGEIHAQLLQDRLREEGIPSRLQPAGPILDAVFVNALYPPNVVGGQLAAARVMVNRRDLDRARQLYQDFELTPAESTTPEQ
jgi:hypothetical protein